MLENFSLRPYQSAQLGFHIQQIRSLNLSSPGTGKTPTACLFINYLVRNEGAKVAFVMPKSLLKKNYSELFNFADFKEEEVAIVTGTPQKRQKIYDNPNVKVFLMGFDMFSKEWGKLPDETNGLVVDEFHMGYKTDSSARTQSFYRAMRVIKWFLGMTGTLIDGRLDSAYPAIRVINPNYYMSYNSFKAMHALYGWDGQLIGWRNHDRLARILSKHAVAIKFEEAYKNSPKPIIISQECEIMNQEQKKAYKEMEEMALVELEDGYLEAHGSGGVKQLRCRQILEAPESVLPGFKGELGKDEALKVHLEDAKNSGKPLLIFSVFRAEQDRLKKLCEEYGFKTELMNGDTSDKNRARIDSEFREGKIDIVIGSPEVMSVGFNWQHVDTVIFVSMGYKDSNFKQAMQRADRGTRKYPLRVIRLYYGVAVEHRLWQIIKRKQEDVKKVGW